MAHRTARLNVFGRQLLVTRIELDGWPVAKAAEAQGVSRTTAHKWIARYRVEGWPGLEDRSSRPWHSPRQTPPDEVAKILRARVDRRWGPHRLGPLTGHPRSTVYAVLARAGYGRLRDADRLSSVPVRYVHDHPGSLIHQDHKKLGRIPGGGGHRMLGRTAAPHGHGRDTGLGYDHFEVVVDDATRLAYVAHVPDESARSASHALLYAAVWFAGHGAVRFADPDQNDIWAERFIKTLLAEWAYGRLYRTNTERLDALRRMSSRVTRLDPLTVVPPSSRAG
jgi:hypothetical protein